MKLYIYIKLPQDINSGTTVHFKQQWFMKDFYFLFLQNQMKLLNWQAQLMLRKIRK